MTIVGVVAIAILYSVLQPSYMPKGTVQRSSVPEFTPSEAVIEDRQSKPVPKDERDSKRVQDIQDGLEFKRETKPEQ